MCRHPNVSQSTNKLHVESIIGEELTLDCPICYDTFESSSLFFTECKHYACVKCTDSMFKKNANDQLESSDQSINYQLVISNIASAIERVERGFNISNEIHNIIIRNNMYNHINDN